MSSEHGQDGGFSLWYRFRATVVYNLLHLGGPAHLDTGADPRLQLEREYLQRKENHQAARQGRPAQLVAERKKTGGPDPLVFMVILSIVAVIAIIGFAVAAN
jgi:hypothetical protein